MVKKGKMKTFNDLEFKDKEMGGKLARLNFENKYGVSVICGFGAYSDSNFPYEVAVLYEGALCYSTPITDDVIGYQNIDGVNSIMEKVQQLDA